MRLLSALGLFMLAASSAAGQTAAPFAIETIAEGLSAPVFVTAPAGDPRLFVVEQSGTIRTVKDGGVSETPFLDVSGDISFGGEQGLLGLAFHPAFADNGRFFINYTAANGDNQTLAYAVSADPDAADPGSAQVLVSIEDFAGNHNGGWIAFGPDGYLYIATGDGGGGGDPRDNGQNVNALLGKILRIDVDGGDPYAIPPENPFAGGGGAPEIFVYGVRNPWRNAFDGDNLYIADVGQNAFEEIHVITTADAGANLGWSVMEGEACFRPAQGCDASGKVVPVHVYSHDEGCSITGGYVYRGEEIPALHGQYLFSDFCAGRLQSITYDGGSAELTDWSALGNVGSVTSFGEDSARELYITTAEGRLLKLVPAT